MVLYCSFNFSFSCARLVLSSFSLVNVTEDGSGPDGVEVLELLAILAEFLRWVCVVVGLSFNEVVASVVVFVFAVVLATVPFFDVCDVPIATAVVFVFFVVALSRGFDAAVTVPATFAPEVLAWQAFAAATIAVRLLPDAFVWHTVHATL